MRRNIVNIYLLLTLIQSCLAAGGAIYTYWLGDLSRILEDEGRRNGAIGIWTLAFFYSILPRREIPYRTYAPAVFSLLFPLLLLVDKYSGFAIIISGVNLALNVYAFVERKQMTRDRWGFFAPDHFYGRSERSSGAVAAAFLLIITISGINLWAYKHTHDRPRTKGFQEESEPGEHYSNIRIYKLNDIVVSVVTHVPYSTEEFYQSVFKDIPSAESLIIDSQDSDQESEFSSRSNGAQKSALVNASHEFEKSDKTPPRPYRIAYVDKADLSLRSRLSKRLQTINRGAVNELLEARAKAMLKVLDETRRQFKGFIISTAWNGKDFVSSGLEGRGYKLISERLEKAPPYHESTRSPRIVSP